MLPAAPEAGVGIIARVPLASGLLSGKYDASTTFAADDHRTYNRDGSAFDVGETFSGVDFETGRSCRQEFTELARRAGTASTAAQAAIAWIWQQPGVTSGHPRCPQRRARPAANAGRGQRAPLPAGVPRRRHRIYDTHLRDAMHRRW